MAHYYRAFGLSIRSALAFDELQKTDDKDCDVNIKFGQVPKQLANPTKRRDHYDVSKNRILLRTPTAGHILIQNGNEIILERDAHSNGKDIRLFLLGSALGAILQQRHTLALHASAVTDNKQCVIVCGKSGHGKSTTAYSLLQKGYEVLSDDICAVDTTRENSGLYSSYPQLKLWKNSLEILGTQSRISDLRKVNDDADKYIIPISVTSRFEIIPIAALICLNPCKCQQPKLEKIGGVEAFMALKQHFYRKAFLVGKSLEGHFRLGAGLLNKTPVYRINRPENGNSISLVSDLVESVFRCHKRDRAPNDTEGIQDDHRQEINPGNTVTSQH